MAEKLRLDMQVLLPEIRDEADACVGRLISELEGKSGIEDVHLRPAADEKPAQLCIHYDPQAWTGQSSVDTQSPLCA